MAKKKVPAYRLHKSSGQAVVTIDGRERYLGPYGSPESKREYDRLIAEWLQSGTIKPAGEASAYKVVELVEKYLAIVEAAHGHKAHGASLISRAERSLGLVTKRYGLYSVNEFGPRALKVVREDMVQAGWSRTYINDCVSLVKRCWRWGVSEELVKIDVLQALETVAGLEQGTPGVHESAPRLDASWEQVEAALPHMTRPVAAAVRVQWHTGMRPSELLAMRPELIDRGEDDRAEVWFYRPTHHKNAWRRQGREILIGPLGQAPLLEVWPDERDDYLFRPAEAVADYWGDPDRRLPCNVGARYTPESYCRAVAKACDRAGVQRFSPYQIRHSFITRISAAISKEAAMMLAGQKSLQSVQRYDHHELKQLFDVVKKIA